MKTTSLRHAIVLGFAATAFAQSPVIDRAEYQPGSDDLVIGFPSESDSYYRVERLVPGSTNDLDLVVGLVPGTGASVSFTHHLAAASRGFFRIRQVPLNAPLDTDGDTLNDVFEFTYPGCMNAMVADDPSANCDGDARTNFEEQGDGTDPTVFDGPSGGGLVINEIDYDQIGTDSNEFIEVYNSSSSAVSLDNLAVVLVNGANNLEYNPRTVLSGTLPAHGYLVLASANVQVAPGAMVIRITSTSVTNPTRDIVQNGAPDGVALVNLVTGALVDSLSYEGSITAATLTNLSGTYNLVNGTPTTLADSNTAVLSLVRLPDGADTGDDATDWHGSPVPTPGAANAGP